MKLQVFTLLLLAGTALARRRDMLNTNRISKQSVQIEKKFLDTCSDCQMIVGKLKDLADDPTKIEEMKLALNFACGYLSGDQAKECRQIVGNLDKLVEKMKPLLDNPKMLCTEIMLCGSEQSKIAQVLFLAVKRQVYKISLPGSERDALCDECQFGLTELKKEWDDKSTQTSIENVVMKFCPYLKSYEGLCETLIKQYWGMVVQFVDQELNDPKAVCTEMGLCSSKFTSVEGMSLSNSKPGVARVHLNRDRSAAQTFLRSVSRTQTAKGNNAGCTICVYSMTALIDSLKNDKQLLTSWANGIQSAVVGLFPTSYQTPMNDFLDRYLEPVLWLAVQQITPRELCDDIKACTSTSFHPSVGNFAKLSTSVKGELVCEACKILAEAMKTELAQKSLQQEIVQEVEQVCNVIPGKYSDTCDSLIEQFAPQIFSELVNYLDTDVCPKIGLCPRKSLREVLRMNANV